MRSKKLKFNFDCGDSQTVKVVMDGTVLEEEPWSTFPVRKTVTQGILDSDLAYCLPLFGGSDIGLVKSIQVLQNKASYNIQDEGKW